MKVGILGGGQLGRMLALDAHRLGLRPLVLDPKPGCSAAAVAPTICAAWDDPDALDRLARCDVVTWEFENVPAACVEALASRVAVRPGPAALRRTADRALERRLLAEAGLPAARFRAVDAPSELAPAAREVGLPAILKTRRFGYDGRGQSLVRHEDELAAAWSAVGERPSILERLVPFEREVSLIAVRARDGEIRFWAPTENRHVGGILRVSYAPAPEVDDEELARARRRVSRLLEQLDYVGVMAVEFFVERGVWIANEVACRVHNSGHWTQDGAATSQFENHLRAVAGLPLGDTRCIGPSAMVNLVGGLPPTPSLCAVDGARPHLYGKAAAPDRKLGHVNLVGDSSRAIEAGLRRLVEGLDDAALRRAVSGPRPRSGR